ncbi:MAG TPA: VanZ family protein [Thermoanaerobaculia bacterium]|nr:VanZ family protein [Thermoanaerobaculia bacterium]
MSRVITIRRPATILLLLLVTLGIILATIWTSGKSYTKVDPNPFDELQMLARRLAERPISTHLLAIIVIPIVGNILLFVPWGFLMFIALYSIERPTVQTYVLTILLGLSFTLAIEAWQYFLPSRVADANDVVMNVLGTLLGALLGHLRLRVRVEFE